MKKRYGHYQYHVEDGQFSFDFKADVLLGKERETIQVYSSGLNNEPCKLYILFVEDNYVYCIGEVERSFPMTTKEHNGLKKSVMAQLDY